MFHSDISLLFLGLGFYLVPFVGGGLALIFSGGGED